MSMRNHGSIFALLALGLSACGGGGGSDAGSDTGVMLSDLPPLEAYTEGATAFEATTADYSCLGTRTAPTGGAPIDVEFQLRDFQDGFEVPGATVWLFDDNMIANECVGACQNFTTDGLGNATVRLPAGGWYAYRVLPFDGPTARTTVFGVFQYNEPAPMAAGGAVEGNSISGTTIDLIPALLGITREAGRAIVAGRFTDCVDEHNIANLQVRIYDPDGNFIQPGGRTTDPNYHYFMGLVTGNVPDQTAQFSASDGLYVVPQVPLVDDRPYRVEAWGNLDGVEQRISCESARLFTDSITILNLGPMRADPDPVCL